MIIDVTVIRRFKTQLQCGTNINVVVESNVESGFATMILPGNLIQVLDTKWFTYTDNRNIRSGENSNSSSSGRL